MKKLSSILLTILAGASLANADTLVIKGSDTLGAKLVPQLAEAFKAQHGDVSFKIAAEGSSTGIAALMANSTNLAMSSRHVTPSEISEAQSKGINMRPTIVAYDGIAVIVNAGNPIASLTKKQVEQIFTGEVKDWSAVGGKAGAISIYTRNTASGTYKDFAELAMKKRNYAGNAQKMAGNEQIAAEVGKNANGIGYVGMAYLNAEGIKAVAVDGLKPSVESVRSKSYAYSRATFYYTNGEPSGVTKAFVDFTLSAAGQKIAAQVGFVPVK
ncbi:MAG: phosphate ABC transporter substrate-binding protein [Verrucomicrobiota bacterium]|nr:phosphate ABC transporter substrate-binding protein [Verrucomicrobiota bacterium]